MRQALKEGEDSGVAEHSLHGLIEGFPTATDKKCPIRGKTACITPQAQNEPGNRFVEPLLLIGSCDCLGVVLAGFLADTFQGLKDDDERDIFRVLPKHFHKEAQEGNPVRSCNKDFLRLMDDKK
jgi:hypothetical protein